MAVTKFELKEGNGYYVDNRYQATISQRDDGYKIQFSNVVKVIRGVAECAGGSKAVLSIGEIKSKQKVVIEPSPLLRREGPP